MRLTRFSTCCAAFLILCSLVGCSFQPNPALESRKQALAKHPQLGVEGSAFNWAFGELYRRLLAEKSQRLLSEDWPMDLATEVSQKLKVAGVPDPYGKSGKVPRTSSSLNAPPTKANFRWR
jgi:hypothetical protein